MKTVFNSHSEVAHIWAQRIQDQGRAGNIFFEGNSIYSYGRHFELARFEKNHVVYNNRSYSISTSKHQGIVRSAVSHYEVFYQSQIDPELILRDLKERWEKLQKARKPQKYWIEGTNPLARFEEYLTKFDRLEQKTILSTYSNKANLKEIKKLAKQLDKFVSNPEIKKVVSNNLKKEREAKERKERDFRRRQKIALKEFKAFERDSLPWSLFSGNEAYIRLSKDGQNVETSKGIKIPVKAAKVLFELIKSGKDVRGHKIEQFTVLSINGSLTVGCHTIPKEDVFQVGNLL